ncbi:S-layer homology domain-containing protein [Sporosarcina sp. GW1-11]|uniref:S-layer homology domain-containing protein n=1 Tax=Sporosarcina sp. GW1-11 TaxID=2899126 RepID=UPI00294F5CD0|nr:S-layer homology domain-containing protein [Sporosarcina sp. GW1-11]MDV6378229.1 S-layer homology domain-containing protein [Sporosarcina sp. GW1-11]
MANQPTKYRKFVVGAASVALVASAVAPVASAATKEFTDIKGNTHEEAINALVAAGAISGYEDGTFKPNKTLTRSDVVKMLGKWLVNNQGYEIPADYKTNPRFADQTDKTNDELLKYSAVVKDNKIFNGYENGTLGATGEITRENMALVLVRAYDAIYKTDLVEYVKGQDFKRDVIDLNKAKAEARPYIDVLDFFDITNPAAPAFNPKNITTRGHFASFLYKTAQVKVSNLPAVSAKAISNTVVEVTFNTAVDAATAENFSIEGGKVNAATLSEDKKKVTLSVSGLAFGKEYTLATKNVKINGEVVEFANSTFKTPAIAEQWTLEVTPKHAQVVADGADNTVIEFRLLGADGKVDTGAKDVVLDIKATFGNLANSRVTIENGIGSVVLASEFSTKAVTSRITAKVIEASEDYKQLIGEITGEGSVTFVPTSATTDPNAVTFLDAESNQADRVVLYFDKDVSPATFLKTTKDGKFVTERVFNGANVAYTKQVLKDTVGIAIHQTDKNGDKKDIIGLRSVEGNAKAIEVILAKTKANGVANHLIDNSRVYVAAKIGKTDNEKTFTLTDARQPEVTSVTPEGMKKLKVKFSESIAKGQFTIDGLLTNKDNDFTVEFGDFDAATGIDNRDIATITLGNYLQDRPGQTAKNLNTQRYFTAGNHTLVTTELYDFAALTDPQQNVSTSQALGFNVADDKSAPVAATTVESPEQFRLSFDKTINTVLTNDQVAKAFQIYDETSAKYLDVFTSTGALTAIGESVFVAGTTATDFFKAVKHDNDYVIELTKDWTKLLKKENDAYYNYNFQFKFAKDAFVNDNNGIGSAEMELKLNYTGSALNAADNVSPVISAIDQLSDQVTFKVSMNEPVKLYDAGATGSKDNAGPTLAVGQAKLAETLVEFQGKNKDGKHVVIPGRVIGYSDKQKGADKAFDVTTAIGQKGLQELVNKDGYSADWTVVVKSISDDVGNTAATLVKDFTLVKEVQANVFEIIAKENANENKANGAFGGGVVKALNFAAGQGQNDRIEITFTKAVNHTDGTSNVTNPSLWTLNGQKLSNVATITVTDADGNKDNGNEKVIITFNNADVLKADSNTVSINKDIISKDGTKLTGFNEIVAITLDGMLADATAAVVNAENLKTQAAVDAARVKVNALKDGAEKTALVNRLNAIVVPGLPGDTVAKLNGTAVFDGVTQRYIVRIPLASAPANTEKVTITVKGVNYDALPVAGRDFFEVRGIAADSVAEVEGSTAKVVAATPKTVASANGRAVFDGVTQRYIVRIPKAGVDANATKLVITVDGVNYDAIAEAGKDYFQAKGINAASVAAVEASTFVVIK